MHYGPFVVAWAGVTIAYTLVMIALVVRLSHFDIGQAQRHKWKFIVAVGGWEVVIGVLICLMGGWVTGYAPIVIGAFMLAAPVLKKLVDRKITGR